MCGDVGKKQKIVRIFCPRLQTARKNNKQKSEKSYDLHMMVELGKTYLKSATKHS